jgi:hypothetical protein
MGAFAHLQLALLDVDDATRDLTYAAFAPAAAGKRPLSKRRMAKAMKLVRALLNESDGDSNSVSRVRAGKAATRQRQ